MGVTLGLGGSGDMESVFGSDQSMGLGGWTDGRQAILDLFYGWPSGSVQGSVFYTFDPSFFFSLVVAYYYCLVIWLFSDTWRKLARWK